MSPITCALCGDRIGMYEPFGVMDVGGSVAVTSALNASESDLSSGQTFHLGCLVPDATD